jgi:predicted amidophosphoribosyltransferase
MQAEVEWEYTMDYAVAIDEAIKVLEKQIPKEVTQSVLFPPKLKPRYSNCPICKNLIEYQPQYCNRCGQKLEWSDSK